MVTAPASRHMRSNNHGGAEPVCNGRSATRRFMLKVYPLSVRDEGAGDMSDQANPKPYHTVTPYLVVHDVARLIEFLKQAFGATERMRLPRPDGSVMHAEVTIGDSIVMM